MAFLLLLFEVLTEVIVRNRIQHTPYMSIYCELVINFFNQLINRSAWLLSITVFQKFNYEIFIAAHLMDMFITTQPTT